MAAKISKAEFQRRIANIQEEMRARNLDVLYVYGDEYRKENLRYVSNYWPLFERGALVMNREGKIIVLCAPEGEQVARESCVWEDIRLTEAFICVTVPDEISYPLAHYTTIEQVAQELTGGKADPRVGVSGLDAMPLYLVKSIEKGFGGEIVDANEILFKLRRTKSPEEMECLREAARIADVAYAALMDADLIGKTELQAASIAEAAARREGAEAICFTVFGSGARTATIIGRPTEKIIEDGDMIMCSLAVQYEGYIASCEVPFVAGHCSPEAKHVIDVLMKALRAGLPYLRAGVPMCDFVSAVKALFAKEGLTEYDVYPPLHGIGYAESESPYPNENTKDLFEKGMACNSDISLFGLAAGSNRIELGFIIGEDGPIPLSPIATQKCMTWKV